jgi:hypothetical protein
MTAPAGGKPLTTWVISDLLAKSVQPFDDLTREELDGLAAGIDANAPLAVPVSVSSDGILLDGHQRLGVLQAMGRDTLDDGEVRVIAAANATNATEWAVRLNVQRRHLSRAQKAEIARRMQAEKGWSQALIAQVFGVSRPAVSQWLKGSPGDQPAEVTGRDGKMYTRPPAPAETARTGRRRTLAEGLAAIATDFGKLPPGLTRGISIGPAGAVGSDPNTWDVRVPAEARQGIEGLADAMENWAGDFTSLARLLRQAARP